MHGTHITHTHMYACAYTYACMAHTHTHLRVHAQALIGVAAVGQAFTNQILTKMAALNKVLNAIPKPYT